MTLPMENVVWCAVWCDRRLPGCTLSCYVSAAMPVLANVKQERFAVYVSQRPRTGWSLARCYTEAGYKANAHSAETCASRMLKKVELELRVRELMEPVVQKSRLTIDFLLTELERTLRDAREDRAHGACVQALALVAKVHEMIAEREAVDHHQFGGAMDSEEILGAIRNEYGDAVAAIIGAAVAGDVYANDLDKALEIIDRLRADLIARVAARAKLVS
jgi:hypothetical protein